MVENGARLSSLDLARFRALNYTCVDMEVIEWQRNGTRTRASLSCFHPQPTPYLYCSPTALWISIYTPYWRVYAGRGAPQALTGRISPIFFLFLRILRSFLANERCIYESARASCGKHFLKVDAWNHVGVLSCCWVMFRFKIDPRVEYYVAKWSFLFRRGWIRREAKFSSFLK